MRRSGRLHECLKPQSVQALSNAFGAGRDFSVPGNTANATHIEEVIGLEQTSRLIDEFGGGTVYLPGDGDNRPKNVSTKQVEKLGSMSALEQSRRLGCSVRNVFHKRKQIREQGDKVSCEKPNQSGTVRITAP